MEDTNQKIDELAALVKLGFDHVGEEMALLRTELKGEISSVRTELKGEISSVRTELKGEILGVRNELSSEISSVRTEISALRSEMHDGFALIDKNFLIVDNKVDKLTAKLEEKKVITKADAKEVMAINPLPLS